MNAGTIYFAVRTSALILLVACTLACPALAMPAGGSIAEGKVSVDMGTLAVPLSGATITAEEDTFLDWDQFDIGAAEELHFDTAKGAIFNVVRAGDVAEFLGKITQTGIHPLFIDVSDDIHISGTANLSGTSVTLISRRGNLRADGGSMDAGKLLIGARKVSLRNAVIQGGQIRIVAVSEGIYRRKGDMVPVPDAMYMEHTKIKSDKGPVELQAVQVTMKDSEVLAENDVSIWVGALSGGMIGDREDWQIDAVGPLHLSNSSIWANEIRTISGALSLTGGSLLANRMNLSIGARTCVHRDADGNETGEEIEVTQANTLLIRNAAVRAKTISLRAGGAGVWGEGILAADESVMPLVQTTDTADAAYRVRRTDFSEPCLLCGRGAIVQQHGENVPGFETVADEAEPTKQ